MKPIKLYYFIILVAITFAQCSHKIIHPFSSFKSSLPELKVPLVIWCGYQGPYADESKIDSLTYHYYAPAGYRVAGKLAPKGLATPILYYVFGDMVSPYIFTYDSTGNLIDSLYLHTGKCYGEWGDWRNAFTIIDTGMNITMLDTLGTYQYDFDHAHIEGTDSAFVCHRVYTLLETGHFQKMKDDSIYIGKVIHE